MADHGVDPREPYPAPRRRRPYAGYAALVLGFAALGYWLSPYVAVVRFALALQSGATEAVTRRIDLNSLRNGFSRQIVRVYLARNPQARGLDPLSRQVVGGVAAGYVAGIVSDYLTPEAIAGLLQGGRSATAAGALLGESTPLPRLEDLAQAWSLFLASGFRSPTRFSVTPAAQGALPAYTLNFGLRGVGWPLVGVELPDAVLGRLADELTARIAQRS